MQYKVEDTAEVWASVKGFEGCYEVSNLGRIKSISRPIVRRRYGIQILRERILKTSTNNSGYELVSLRKENKTFSVLVHRIVAMAFIPNPNGYRCINHKDENKHNNSVDNLEWCTHKYNANYGTAIVRQVATNSLPVLQFSCDGDFIARFPSLREAERVTGVRSGNISKSCRRIIIRSGGYVWRYADKTE